MALDQIDVDKIGEAGETEMTFLDHLEELRWHIIRSLIAIIAVGITLFIFQDWLFNYIILDQHTKILFLTNGFVVFLRQ